MRDSLKDTGGSKRLAAGGWVGSVFHRLQRRLADHDPMAELLTVRPLPPGQLKRVSFRRAHSFSFRHPFENIPLCYIWIGIHRHLSAESGGQWEDVGGNEGKVSKNGWDTSHAFGTLAGFQGRLVKKIERIDKVKRWGGRFNKQC